MDSQQPPENTLQLSRDVLAGIAGLSEVPSNWDITFVAVEQYPSSFGITHYFVTVFLTLYGEWRDGQDIVSSCHAHRPYRYEVFVGEDKDPVKEIIDSFQAAMQGGWV